MAPVHTTPAQRQTLPGRHDVEQQQADVFDPDMKRAIKATICTALLGVLSACGTIDTRVVGVRPYEPPVYPAVAWDCRVVGAAAQGTGEQGPYVWWAIPIVVVGTVCDLPVSIAADTICLSWDAMSYLRQETKPTCTKCGSNH